MIVACVAPGAAMATTEQPEAVAQTLTPQSEAIKTALARTGDDDARRHYEFSAYKGIWFTATGDDSKARALLGLLERAADEALPVARYRTPLLRAALDGAAENAAATAAAELAFTEAYLDFVRDRSRGVLEPRNVDRELHVFPERLDGALLLDRLAASATVEDALKVHAPQDPRYARLVAELERLRALPPGAWGSEITAGGSIRIGERSSRVTAMRERLIALGDHIEPAASAPATASSTTQAAQAPDVYDEALETSVRAFQRRHGLNDDGVAGRRTIAAMNVGVEERIGQVVVALERLRWMNRDLGHRHVYVNQADFTVQLREGGEVLFSERVVVGKARKHRTPEFSDEMTHMVFNPVWHVPRSIATEEILPKLQEDPEYLLKKNMRLVAPGGEAAPDPATTDWSLYSQSDFPYRIKQRSGGGNALGRVKFMFPNQFAIYLHDTPSKRLFSKDARAFSHGCVRVQDPMAFARALLAPQREDASAYIDRLLARAREATVTLKEPVPVHLTYLTAWIDDAGVAQYRDDVYGRDRRILAALQAAGAVVGADG